MLADATNGWSTVLLLLLLAVGGWIDLREARIPNLMVLYGIVLAFALHGLVGGTQGVASAMVGMLIAAGLLLPWCLIGGMAAGDVKLMGMVGAFLGPEGAAAAVALTLVAGLVLAVLVLSVQKLRRWLRATRARSKHETAMTTSFPYAPAMVAGTVVWLWSQAELQPAAEVVVMLWTG